jgi:extracellular elastinolytic metalloproteinase
MYARVKSFVIAAAVLSIAAGASAQGRRPFDTPPARVAQPPAGSTLTPPSTAAPRAVLAQYLRGLGRDQATADSLVETTSGAGRNGITQAQFEQRAAGLPVFGTYAKAAFNSRGELVHLIENLVSVDVAVGRARINAQQAINAAVATLYPTMRTTPAGFFRQAPTATRVVIPHANGALTTGFLVETWTQQANQLHETLVDGDGTVVGIESRTSNDSYNVFRYHPNAGAQTIVAGPGAGNAQSPAGWLFAGAQNTINIGGNNVRAYLDAVSDNRIDSGGTSKQQHRELPHRGEPGRDAVDVNQSRSGGAEPVLSEQLHP